MNEMSFRRYVLYCDYDGTLTGRNGILRKGTEEAVKRFTDAGGLFAMASGRPVKDAAKFPFMINAPSVLQNGALVYDTLHETLLRYEVMHEEIQEILLDLHERVPEAGISLCLLHGRRYAFFFYEPVWPSSYVLTFSDLKDLHDHRIFMNKEFTQASITGTKEMLKEAEEMLDELHPEVSHFVSAPGFVNITAKKATKGQSIRWLKENLYQDRILIVCGDGANDLDMMKEADVSFAMEEGFAKTREAADVILPSDDVSPVVRIQEMIRSGEIEKILQIKRADAA